MSPAQRSLVARLINPNLPPTDGAQSEASQMIEDLAGILKLIAEHPYGNHGMCGEPEAEVLSAFAKVALGDEHGLTGLALEWWHKEDEDLLTQALESSRHQ